MPSRAPESERPLTDRTRSVLELANLSARRLGHAQVEPEHVLDALVLEGEGVAAAVLQNLRVDFEGLRWWLANAAPQADSPAETTADQLPNGPRIAELLEAANEAAADLRFDYIGTEVILLGLLRRPAWPAAKLLVVGGVTLERAQAEVRRLLGIPAADEADEPPAG